MRTFALLLLLLAACDRGPEVPTSAENRDLDDAATMLDNADSALPGADENALAPGEPASAVTP